MFRRSVGGNVRYALRASGVARAEQNGRIGDLLALVGLEQLGRSSRSPALRWRAAATRAGSRARPRPEILLLDEPTASLDPAATKAIEDIIRAVGQRGIKVVMATHDLGEARRLGGEIVLLHRGRAIESGPASSNSSIRREAAKQGPSSLENCSSDKPVGDIRCSFAAC